MATVKVVIVGKGMRPKLRPRGRPFKKGERHSFQFQPGQSGNPGGKPKVRQRLSTRYAALLGQLVPESVAQAMSLPQGSTWADAIARGIVLGATKGDVAAARELREVTEGRMSKTVNLQESFSPVDYAREAEKARAILLGSAASQRRTR